jgi:hypothetical protein
VSRLAVVWFDPGVETGWCVIVVDDFRAHDDPVLSKVRHFAAGVFHTGWSGRRKIPREEFDEIINEQVDECIELCQLWNNAAYGVEDFALATNVRGREVLAPVRVMAGVEWALWSTGIVIEKQMPHERSIITEERLRRWGFWVPGNDMDDARSATQHALAWLRKAASNPKIAARAWGGERGDWNVREVKIP